MVSDFEVLLGRLNEIGVRWSADRPQRQLRRHLERDDFDALRRAGLLLAIVPVEHGGLWRDVASSVRPLCACYRQLATADPSVALVSAMHAAVVSYWLLHPDDSQPEWEAQRSCVFASAATGDQWGTITSEPGSGGDIAKTRTVAAPSVVPSGLVGATYGLRGDKHFGSGSGMTTWMVTTAIPQGETAPTIFVLDVLDRPWDGTRGLQLVAEWDGMGMTATQSHAMHLDNAPAVRLAWDGPFETITRAAGPFIATLFTGVILGVVDAAIALARDNVRNRADSLSAYERIEWVRAEQDHWLAVQAYEGALRAVESGSPTVDLHAALRAKESVADLAEATLSRLTRVIGGGAFSARSPFAHWFEDVRALGFLRPPWGLAYDQLFATSIA